jgi:small-conductance mechanosensitive channel
MRRRTSSRHRYLFYTLFLFHPLNTILDLAAFVKQVRTCDGCYNRVMDLQEKKGREDMLGKMKPVPKANSEASKQYLADRAKLMAEAAAADEEKAKRPGERGQASASQTVAALSETREALHQRGEKLSKLSDRSELLANQANDFAKMAKALNEQQKNRWF